MSDFLNSILPTTPIEASIQDPRVLLIYSDFKVGKSVLASNLSLTRKALWLDYEDGSEGLPGIKINVIKAVAKINEGKDPRQRMSKIGFLLKLWGDLAAEKTPRYDFIIHDKIDNLETWAEGWATAYYKDTVIGRNFTGSTVLELPEGGGFLYLREKFQELWNTAIAAAPRSIFFASLRSKYVGKESQTVESKDLDLCGKVRKIAAGFADAPGFMWREQDSSNWISFVSGEKGAFCGCRIPRLEGKKLRISWKEPDGRVVVDWGKIYQGA